MRPPLTGASPATAESSVDLPAPFEPMTETNSPGSMRRSMPSSARFSSGVPRAKVDRQVLDADHARAAPPRSRGRMRASATSTAVARLRSEAFRPITSDDSASCDGDPIEDRADDAADQRHRDAAEAEQRLADDDGGKADDDGADAGGHVGEAVGLREHARRRGRPAHWTAPCRHRPAARCGCPAPAPCAGWRRWRAWRGRSRCQEAGEQHHRERQDARPGTAGAPDSP